ncbi:hypothetical protein CS369_21780 (plasmid) [Candidatus Symbiopectobacterium sp. 'North America']|nr:hypothetical protein [Candidatus Symbiopectobacterium sp. 'North America']
MKILRKHHFVLWIAFTSCAASAAGIPLINPSDPIRVSQSPAYRCDASGHALQRFDDGSLLPLIVRGKSVTCQHDQLWLDGKNLSYMDLVHQAAHDAKQGDKQ